MKHVALAIALACFVMSAPAAAQEAQSFSKDQIATGAATPPLIWCRGMPGICLPGTTKIFPSASAKGLFGDASFPEN
jgi:hypothetical protein